jgi:16S rRNA (adenine1518-N6/adenine1519-N6)-dimethyltransferase
LVYSEGLPLKKKYGQHFLRDQQVVDHMLDAVSLTPRISLLEIGCGDCFLTRFLVQTPVARLWVFEIDANWAQYAQKQFQSDTRVSVFHKDFLHVKIAEFEPYTPWIVLANLPYQITFPILHIFTTMSHLLHEGVIMVQEEVAQKIAAKSGRPYGFISLYFQHYFDWKLLDKVPPSAFYPPPAVFSRLLYFKPRASMTSIPQEEQFWIFIKVCFKQPRRTLQNNLRGHPHYHSDRIPSDILRLRAQQLTMADFIILWTKIIG